MTALPAPTRQEIDRIRVAWENYVKCEPDGLSHAALVFSIPRLLARIGELEERLIELSRIVRSPECDRRRAS